MKNGKKSIYLHIGMPKAGSKSIQKFLFDNRFELEKYGVFYPVIPCDNEKNYNIVDWINFRKITLDILPKGIEVYNEYFEKNFLPLIDKNNCNKIIFSDELLYYRDDTSVTDVILKHEFDLKVIVSFRNPAEYIVSQWQENIKPYIGHYNNTLDMYIENAKYNYSIIIKYIEKLGKKNVILRPFDKELWKNGNLIDDFLEVLGVYDFKRTKQDEKQNGSYNRTLSEYMLLLKSPHLTIEQITELSYDYAKLIVPKEELSKIDIKSPVDLTFIIEKYSSPLPKIIDTVPQEKIDEINKKQSPIIKQITSYYSTETKLISYINKNEIKNDKQVFDKLILTSDELKILHKSINFATQNYNKLLVKYKEETRKIPFYQKIFSIKNSDDRKIIRFLGIKLKLKIKKNL